jgi:excinuclease UvrABC helicase subunit UvrB
MKAAAEDLRFEDAANFRDQMREMESRLLGVDVSVQGVTPEPV